MFWERTSKTYNCAFCGEDLSKFGGGSYSSDLRKVYCPHGPDNHCLEIGMTAEGHDGAILAEFKTIKQLRKLEKKGLLY